MQKRILPLAITALFISLFGWNCTKLDTTDIGGDLLPDVDNVNTFADTLLINSTQETYFSDSTYIAKNDDYAVGKINNDPLFGTTTASIYLQLKPSYYPFFFGNAGDTISGIPGVGLDSIVLCLKYKGFWGDSTLPVSLQVREVRDDEFRDSLLRENKTNYFPNTLGNVLGSTVVDVFKLPNYIKFSNGRDSVNNQIRIKITDPAWISALFNRDSLRVSNNNAFYNDSTYRHFYNGLAIIPTGSASNGLLYASLADTATKLEVHYRRKAKGSTTIDSVYSSLRLNPIVSTNSSNPASNTSNHILRNRSAIMLNPNPGEHYIQTSPGTFVNLNIPGLATLSNRVIHRAEIIVEQIPSDPVYDQIFSTPNFMYLELKDTGTINKWKPVYFDLNTSQSYDPDYKNGAYFLPTTNGFDANINYNYFGGFRRIKPDPFTGGYIKYYTFNISRYVQQIVTNHTKAYDMRLSAPFNLQYPQYARTYFAYGNNIAYGRVRIGSGSNPNYRMKLRIVYSKL